MNVLLQVSIECFALTWYTEIFNLAVFTFDMEGAEQKGVESTLPALVSFAGRSLLVWEKHF